MPEPIVVAGSSVAAAVAVERLADRGESVRWLRSNAPLGAGFSGIEINGSKVNLGPRLIELSYVANEQAQTSPAWSTYRAGHDGHRPWQARVARYLAELLDGAVQCAPNPELWWRGKRGADCYFTGNLEVLPTFLDRSMLMSIAAETAERLAAGPAGGVHHDGTDLSRLELTQASLANHGATFHRALIDPLARRLRSGGTDGVIAALHNKLWLPLYWPRTLWEAASGAPIAFKPDRSFQTDASGGMSLLIEQLASRISDSKNVRSERVGQLLKLSGSGGRVAFEFADGEAFNAERVVLGSSPEELFGAVGLAYTATRLELRLIWIEVAADQLSGAPPSALTLVDDESPLYRVSASGRSARPGHHVLAVELAHGHAEPSTAELTRELARVGVLHSHAQPVELGRKALRAFSDPTLDNAQAFCRAQSAFRERMGDVALVGPAAGFGADPLNEQVLQGIRIAEVLS